MLMEEGCLAVFRLGHARSIWVANSHSRTLWLFYRGRCWKWTLERRPSFGAPLLSESRGCPLLTAGDFRDLMVVARRACVSHWLPLVCASVHRQLVFNHQTSQSDRWQNAFPKGSTWSLTLQNWGHCPEERGHGPHLGRVMETKLGPQ